MEYMFYLILIFYFRHNGMSSTEMNNYSLSSEYLNYLHSYF